MPYSRQTENSQVFFHVGLCYHSFSWIPNEEIALHSRAKLDEGTFFYTGESLSLLPPSSSICSSRDIWDVRATR